MARGDADFQSGVRLAYVSPTRRLACSVADRVRFRTRGPRVLPLGEAYIRGNVSGILRNDKVSRASTRPGGRWNGTWVVVRNGKALAVVEYPGLSGTACLGSGIGGA